MFAAGLVLVGAPHHFEQFVDAAGIPGVGAIDGLLRGASARDIAEKAGRFAARVCGLAGAVAEDKEFYRHE